MGKNKKTVKTLSYSIFSLAAILLSLGLCGIIVANDIFCWFSKNENVVGSGMSFAVSTQPIKVEYKLDSAAQYTEIDLSTPIAVTEGIKAPNDYATVNIKITNLGTETVTVGNFGISNPLAQEEVAKDVNGSKYYLGTEISAQLLSYKVGQQPISNINTPTEHRLYTDGQNDEIDFVADIGSAVTLQGSESVEFTVKLTFVDSGLDQNVYKGFGAGSECCQRRIYVKAA